MNPLYYMPDGESFRPADRDEFFAWYEESGDLPFREGGRRVAFDALPGGLEVSTVFLGIDHPFGEGEPVLFETMVFRGERDKGQWRYNTLAEAEQGHAQVVAELKAKAETTEAKEDKP